VNTTRAGHASVDEHLAALARIDEAIGVEKEQQG
jgi:hypothetical protein